MKKNDEWALNPTPEESAWIKYKFNLAGLSASAVARKLDINRSLVSNVIAGRLHSKKIEKEIATVCGYPSWNDMLRTLRGENVA